MGAELVGVTDGALLLGADDEGATDGAYEGGTMGAAVGARDGKGVGRWEYVGAKVGRNDTDGAGVG